MKFKNLVTLVLFLFTTGMVCSQNRPNIIFILSDDHAYQAISAYGNTLVQTPNIDRIAKEGVLIENNFVVNSICGPSRASLITGKYSHKNGYYDNSGKEFDVNQFVFSELLQTSGYQTAWIGKMHLNSLPKGFDYLNVLSSFGGQGSYFNPEFVDHNKDTVTHNGYVTNVVTDLFVDWLDQQDRDRPFFAVVR